MLTRLRHVSGVYSRLLAAFLSGVKLVRLKYLVCLFVASVHSPVFASGWGTLQVAAEREWTTEKEPQERVTKFRWVEPGRILEARHGPVSRLQFGENKFAETVQRMVLDPATGRINVTYSYEDGRPLLKAVITIEADGTAIELFTDVKGIKRRNIYKLVSPSVTLIERQELQGGTWATLSTTRKGGLTAYEIAEKKHQAERARRMADAQEAARKAAEQARQEAELAQQASYHEEQPLQQGMNVLGVLNGLATSIQRQNQRQQRSFERQIRANSRGGSGSGDDGAIIVENSPTPTYTPPPKVVAQTAPSPADYSTSPPKDTCKRREPRTYGGVYTPKYTVMVCLDASKVSAQ